MSSSFFDTMPRVISHRGACGHAPENTLASFKAAADLGAKSIEIDGMVTADNQVVICHDSSVNRCTNGQGAVLLKTLEEVRALDAGSKFDPKFEGEKIPTLQELIDALVEFNMSVNFEIKPTAGWQVETTLKIIEDLNKSLPDTVPLLFSSFNIEALEVAYKHAPEIERGYLTEAVPVDWERRLKAVGAASLHCHHSFATTELIKAVQDAGIRFLVYTVNNPEDGKRLLDWGVDAIITDYPDRMFEFV
ncbi:glycerophosphoryl diester phosphodiesterase [Sneathiella sp. P13V-1]|uniref:glycerophosphoryl diester phosphodiesterase n=1 Tax=Sneathiella sp. P13V-1 TaxID=2697366 RepID=UPI00187B9985|nr:glycerophosphoryl diester phosphodiesterase [Sneathiella sp. P13V-1]MBE7637253.1 glycerophosphoryl diester phosphodiesterase [Sneathiella sp. P13V-1]